MCEPQRCPRLQDRDAISSYLMYLSIHILTVIMAKTSNESEIYIVHYKRTRTVSNGGEKNKKCLGILRVRRKSIFPKNSPHPFHFQVLLRLVKLLMFHLQVSPLCCSTMCFGLSTLIPSSFLIWSACPGKPPHCTRTSHHFGRA